MARKSESMCWRGECRSQRVNFRVLVNNMEKELVKMQNGGPDLFDEPGDWKMLHNEDKRAFALRERQFGRYCDVQDNVSFFQGEQNKTGGSRVQVEVSVEVEEHIERLVRCTHVLRDGDT